MPVNVSIPWLDWSQSAFDRARREQKPLVVSIVTRWSEPCAAMDRDAWSDARVIDLASDRFVPVRVDADRRPDIADRYTLGGWPTVACLTPSGALLAAHTFMNGPELLTFLGAVAKACEGSLAELDARAGAEPGPSPREPAGIDRGAIDWLADCAAREFDDEYGGFGRGAKSPHAPMLRLLIARSRRTGGRLPALVSQTLDAMMAGELHDRLEGGFFRYAVNRDWTAPAREKVLADQAALVQVFLDAADLADADEYRECAASILRYVHTTLADRDAGGFHASVDASGAIDSVLFVDANAAMSAAYLRAAAAFGERDLADFGLRSLERVVLAGYRPGSGVAHDTGADAVRGLLIDHVSASEALLAAADATGDEPYSMLAEELMRHALRVMWDPEGGGFFDRAAADDPSGFDLRPLKPLALNCDAARVLARLAHLTGSDDYRARASDALASQTPVYREHGLLGAPYGLALAEIGGDSISGPG